MAEIGHISHHDATDVMANSILPNVKVTKIILNGGASANVSEFETDPHVDGVHHGGGVQTQLAMEHDQTSDTPQDTLSVSVDVEMFELEENMLNNALDCFVVVAYFVGRISTCKYSTLHCTSD